MINASELRIGNWVETYVVMLSGAWYDTDGNKHGQDVITEPTIRQKQIDINDLKIIASSALATYRPIPLSPDILVKCGFVKIKDILDEGRWSNGYLHIHWNKEYAYLPFRKTEYKYLHQLQNLYHSLTQTELNINL